VPWCDQERKKKAAVVSKEKRENGSNYALLTSKHVNERRTDQSTCVP
jgi:hypothetical protein